MAELRRALRPELGHMVSFEGSLFHGGEPIVRGTRYVIAAFLYVSQPAAAPAGDSSTAESGTCVPPATSAMVVMVAKRAKSVLRALFPEGKAQPTRGRTTVSPSSSINGLS